MKRLFIIIAVGLTFASCNNSRTPQLKDAEDSVSWILGRNTAESIVRGPFGKIDKEIFIQAIRATFDSMPQPISDTVYNATIAMLMQMAQSNATQKSNDIDSKQEKFFANLVATNPKIKRHPSGFYYEQIKAGTGPNAYYAAHIYFDYRGYYMFNGKLFDQTYGQREPISHVVGKPMFPGLIEAFQLMNKGSIYRFYFPYQLAFGASGSDDIPPYTPLIYELELHSISSL